ncbi:hypothetical protein ACWDZ4_12650 [Streptomyces sp. NPDC003016]
MLSRPRSLLFYLVLVITLFIIATAPVEFARTVLTIWRAMQAFFNSLTVLIQTLSGF